MRREKKRRGDEIEKEGAGAGPWTRQASRMSRNFPTGCELRGLRRRCRRVWGIAEDH